MKNKIKIIIPISILIIVLLFFNSIVNFIVDVQWFKEIHYLSVYFTKLLAVFKIMVPIFMLVFISVWIYYNSLKKSIYKWNHKKNIDMVSDTSSYNKKFIILNMAISLIVSLYISKNYWYTILQFTNSQSFNISDPIFKKDLSFFIFKLPLIESIYKLFIGLFSVLIVVTFIIFIILNTRDKVFNKTKITSAKEFRSGITKFAGKQLAILACFMLLVIALGYKIRAWNLVYSPRGVVFGASYTDVKVSLSFYKVIMLVSLIAGVIVFISILISKIKPIVISILTIILLVVVEPLSSTFVQNFIVRSNEKTLEKKYVKYNIDYTRKAFNIDNIESKDFVVENNLKYEDIINNEETISNIKINSTNQVLEYYNQLQVLKYYYTFKDMDVDRYKIGGRNTQVFVSAREIDVNSLKDKASTWQNKHLTYTHGYGIVVNKVNAVTPSGRPEFLIKDMPLESNLNINLKNPRIYFGEETNEYAIVNTKIGELDYPDGDVNKTTKYNGKAGIKMNSINKIIMSIYEKNIKFLLSKDITKESKILINRNIKERVKKIAPFLLYDKDPYIVIDNEKLYWIMDAYTVTDRYPFSQPYNSINYIRNSVKVIIDAVDGTVDFYIIDENDPIIKSFSKIFPGLFKNISDMPKGLKEHIKYPEDLFNLQCNVLGKYHVVNPMVFYSSDDLWEISKNENAVNNEDKEEKNSPSYIIMKLPGENTEEMVVTQYFNVNKKNNMEALLCGRMDNENYGKLILYNFNNESIDSPYLFKQNIKQDPNISKEFSLWNQKESGSGVIFGDTQIIPIRNSLLYIVPLYIRASGKESIPQVKRVIVSYGDKIVIEENIEKALKLIFNIKDKSNAFDVNKSTIIEKNKEKDNIKKAKDLYDKAMEAQKKGKLAEYGEYIEKLGILLQEMNK